MADFTVAFVRAMPHQGDPPRMARIIQALHDIQVLTLPQSRIVLLPGEQHAAFTMAADLFARDVLKFFSEPLQIEEAGVLDRCGPRCQKLDKPYQAEHLEKRHL